MRKRHGLAAGLVVLFAVTAIAQADFGEPGRFLVADSRMTVQRPDGSSFEALLYAPSNAPPVLAFPVVAFGHGFLSPPELYRETCRHLASHGFIVVATRSGLELFPDHEAYAQDLSHCLSQVAADSLHPDTRVYGIVDTNRFGVAGHSMGGGASILAASMDRRISAVATLAAAETFPTSAVIAAAGLAVPLCLVVGSEDRIAFPWRHQIPMYQHAGSPRLLPIVRGGSHCGFLDYPLPDAVCDDAGLPLPEQRKESRRLLTAFFSLYLQDNGSAWGDVWGPEIALDPDILAIADAGVVVEPRMQRRRVAPEQAVLFHVTVTHTGDAPESYYIDASGNRSGFSASPGTTKILAPGESETVEVSIALPAGARVANTYVTARRVSDPRTGRFATIVLRARR
jgi:dienelactone hydrolase